MILYRSQRDHDEYLWLGIFSVNFWLFVLIITANDSGWLPLTTTVILLVDYSGWLAQITHIEFVMRFTRFRHRWPIRIVQGVFLIPPALDVFSSTRNLYWPALLISIVVIVAVEAICLISAFRRGLADSGLLLLPCTAFGV
jgi:hypothetical protein